MAQGFEFLDARTPVLFVRGALSGLLCRERGSDVPQIVGLGEDGDVGVAAIHAAAEQMQRYAVRCAWTDDTHSASALSVSTQPRDIAVERIRPLRERAALRAESRRGET